MAFHQILSGHSVGVGVKKYWLNPCPTLFIQKVQNKLLAGSNLSLKLEAWRYSDFPTGRDATRLNSLLHHVHNTSYWCSWSLVESMPHSRGSAAYAQTLVDERRLISTSQIEAFADKFVVGLEILKI